MRIKRLEVFGFKSFVDPTVIDFDASIVGVVGPNGCGKSNVVDAIRWVMGEMSAKSLRGRSMEDVIFNGSEKRPPLGMAEVTLTFSTEDGIAPAEYAGFTEISIMRRLYRSGESEYLINKVPSRLRDVIDLFLGTGVGHRAYSVIEQGKIDFVVNAKPEDRRLLIEEAAGVSKFKARKESALRKMEGTVQNLARLKDIYNEVCRQINSLDRQVKKAERYKTLKNELRELEIKVGSLTYLESNREMVELKALLDEWTKKETASSSQLAILESDLERGRLEAVEKDRQYSTLQEKYFEVSTRLQLLEAQNGFQKKEKENLEEVHQQALRNIEEMKRSLEGLKLEKEDIEKKKVSIEQDSGSSHLSLDATESEWIQTEQNRQSLLQRNEKIREERHRLHGEIARLEGDKRLHEEKKISWKGQIAQKEVERSEEKKRLEEKQALLNEKRNLLEDASSRAAALKSEMEATRERIAKDQERRAVLTEELTLRKEELVLKRSRLKSLQDLERNFEGYEEGVRSILRAKKERGESNGIFGVVAEFVDTPPQYEMALSAALGERLQYVIVTSHQEGVEAINYLKTQSSGRSSFIPIEVRESVSEGFSYQQPGVIGPLLNLVRLRGEFSKIGQYLLGDFVLVESLSDALSLWRSNGHKKSLVTLEGEVVDPFGVVSGGNGIRGKALLEKKREIAELRALINELEDEIGLQEDTHSQLEGKLSERTLSLEQGSRQNHQVDLKRMSLESVVLHLSEEVIRMEKELLRIDDHLTGLYQEVDRTEMHLAGGERARTEIAIAQAAKESEIVSTESQLREVENKARQIQEKLTQLKIQAAGWFDRKAMVERDAERLLKTEQDLEQRIQQEIATITEANQKKVLLDKTREEATAEIVTLKKASEGLAVTQEEARVAYDTLAATLQENEAQVRELRKENDLSKSHTGDLRVTLSRVETDLHHLGQQMMEKYSVDLSEVSSTFAGVEIDRVAEDQRLTEWKEKIERLGDVNLGAIPEYEELKTRQEFLGKQIADLESSLEALKKAIQRINQTTKKRFEETFAMVNERFQTLFPRLFSGGRAELRLNQEQDLMNAGVDLLVQPPGKKLSHIGLLSGGEKAMSAVAFVFSIFLVKPSPFCILDEVDAPLDDVNTERFHKLLSEMVSRTQFILITHNRRTMEKCDLLYGVTMQDPGVSKLVSVRLTEGLKLAS